ncbi:MAG TPA: hypothetical protein VLA61_24505 [Ideonella sp.]|uniref:hypothetical protein n=1 Tax=Ideonella sp. TaxID=1929293 RepID=UPI002C357346|nr:hypothetical protein [Ideonella sp.]HSI51442.1 hypothetical protein [Ideonella sp.]
MNVHSQPAQAAAAGPAHASPVRIQAPTERRDDGPVFGAGPRTAETAAPVLRIGRIDVTVLAPAAAPAAPRLPAGGDASFLSRNYLRRL